MERTLFTIIARIEWFWEYFRVVVDISLVAVLMYFIYRLLSKSRTMPIIKGLAAIFAFALVSKVLRLDTVNWIIQVLSTSIVVAVIILFQHEIKKFLSQFGTKSWFSVGYNEEALQLDELVSAIISMSEEKMGSLIVIERNTSLRAYIESGVSINAGMSEELIRTIFHTNTDLHDGAIIVQENKIMAAACYLPLSDSKLLKKHHGARHRAALGIAEETDALVVVTSEETGGISVMVNGKLFQRIRPQDIKSMINFFRNPKTMYEEKYSSK
jgi:diadenylate cyclase